MLLLTYQPAPSTSPANKSEAKQLKTHILEALSEHLKRHGRSDYDLVRERADFRAVIGREAGESGRRKFFRWLEQVSKVASCDTTRPHEDRGISEQHNAWAEKVAADLRAENPNVAPSSAYIAKMGADGRSSFNLVASAHQIFADIDLMRRSALTIDASEPGGVVVKDSALLDRSILRATQMLKTMIDFGHHMTTLDLTEEFFRMIVDVVIQEMPPEATKRTMHRLKDINDTWALMKSVTVTGNSAT